MKTTALLLPFLTAVIFFSQQAINAGPVEALHPAEHFRAPVSTRKEHAPMVHDEVYHEAYSVAKDESVNKPAESVEGPRTRVKEKANSIKGELNKIQDTVKSIQTTIFDNWTTYGTPYNPNNVPASTSQTSKKK